MVDISVSLLRSNEVNNALLSSCIGLNVALGGAGRLMAGQNLNVSEGPAYRRDLTRRVRDERSPSTMAGTAVQPYSENPAVNRLTMAADENCSERSVVMT